MTATALLIRRADYADPEQAAAIVDILNEYAKDSMGGGEALPREVQARLVPELAKRPWAVTVLGYWDGEPVGLVNAFEGFSSFAAQPLIYLHDVAVNRSHRGRGVAKAMLTEVEAIARERGACKMTLEVLSGNPAVRIYDRFGFKPYALDPKAGTGQFMQKWLR